MVEIIYDDTPIGREIVELQGKINEAQIMLDGKHVARNRYGRVCVEYNPIISTKLTMQEKEQLKEDIRHYENLLHQCKIEEEREKKEKIASRVSSVITSTKVAAQLKTVDLGNGNKIAINPEKQSIWIGGYEFYDFDQILLLFTDRSSSPSTRSQRKSGIVLLYAIACYSENSPHSLPIADLMKHYNSFRDSWTNRDLAKRRKTKKNTLDKNDVNAANFLLAKCGLTIAFKIDRSLGEIRIKSD